MIPDEAVPSDTGYYHGVHVVLHFHKDDGVDWKEKQADVDLDTNEEDMEDGTLDDKESVTGGWF